MKAAAQDSRWPELVRDGSAQVKIYREERGKRPAYRLAFYSGRRRQRRFFVDYQRAKEEARRILASIRAGRIEAAAVSISELEELNAATRALAGLNISLSKAAHEYAEAHRLLSGRSVSAFIQTQLDRMGKLKEASVLEVAQELVAEKEARGRGRHWIRGLRHFLVNQAGPKIRKPILAVTAEDLEEFLRKWGGRTRNNKISYLVTLFNYAKGKYLPEGEATAAQRLEKDRENPREVQIWSPEEARRVLDAAEPEELGFFAISMFAGIRTEELLRMDWSQVRPSRDPDESHIEVKRAASKMGLGRRIVPILPALAAYLKKIKPPKAGRIAPCSKMENRIAELAKRAGLTWRKNGNRHSFGSYRLAEVRNVFQVAEEMGNTPGMIKKHYFQAVTKAEAARFWAIRP